MPFDFLPGIATMVNSTISGFSGTFQETSVPFVTVSKSSEFLVEWKAQEKL